MKVRFYIAPQQGDGTYLNPYRSIITDYVDFTSGGGVLEMDSPARRISLAYVLATDLEHSNIMADVRVIPLSLLMDVADLSISLDTDISFLPSFDVIKTKLEAHGISCTWITTNTIRDVIRYIIKLFHITQKFAMKDNALTLLKQNLGTTTGTLPVIVRNTIKTWMQNKGLAIGWITNATTVREVLHFILENLGIGKFKMQGVEF